MEFGERKRRRKSQSFKVVTDEDVDQPLVNSSCTDANEESKDSPVDEAEEEEEPGTEIKRQITGMMRLLSDKTGRVYQRTGAKGDDLKKDPQDYGPSWVQPPATLPHLPENHNWTHAAEPEPSSSCPIPIANGQRYTHETTCSTAPRVRNQPKDEANDKAPPSSPEGPCCMHSCQGTLQAILQELRSMRRLMQTQQASLVKQDQAASPQPTYLVPGPAPLRRARKRRPVFKMTPLNVSGRRASVSTPGSPSCVSLMPPITSLQSRDCDGFKKGSSGHAEEIKLAVQNISMAANNQHTPLLSEAGEPQPKEPAVRLAEEYDVFIPKAQLDSILLNYTRSGSLLFRKLVCAFFDDSTLANSLPNGKRKRGLNDNRKGLDQNIVGAIKGFTEKYCKTYRIEKLPGPRDWVQILQDQIKLARRRLKRDAEDVSSKASSSRACI
ncbi:BEN domain-containing protein 7 [Gadus macrocephalus]|uniref:BEN domain-containing protein 7 n=1 Tax=Gadus macrocephalus TaxID=80720 RepID=UPI0028CBA0A1|nr:BEN domain-containing protein 7 [Gadus macrocephalus]